LVTPQGNNIYTSFVFSDNFYGIAGGAASCYKTINLMAEINQHNHQQRTGPRRIRSKKLSTRIDMTPMVDLAFLLLTFFILTSSLQKQRAMNLTMPDKDSTNVEVNYKNVLHIVLAGDDRLFHWTADDPAQETTFSNAGIRQILLARRNNPRLTVLIKPKDESKYQSIIDILDEMNIAAIERYAIVDFSADDKLKVAELTADRR
jgi:biopolymer transport protein ExbD